MSIALKELGNAATVPVEIGAWQVHNGASVGGVDQPEAVHEGERYRIWAACQAIRDLIREAYGGERRRVLEAEVAPAEPADSALTPIWNPDIWLVEAMKNLRDVAELPDNWDNEGSRSIHPSIIRAAVRLLGRLQADKDLDVPVPFAAPIAGGYLQLEWRYGGRCLELEFLDENTVLWLQREGDIICKGRHSLAEAERIRTHVEWLASLSEVDHA